MTKKRIFIICAMVLLAVMLCVGTTYALLLSRSRTVTNTFVSGDIVLTLTESTGSEYTLVPGCELFKDPRITVKAGSEECWLFFKAEGDNITHSFVSFDLADGWTPLDGEEGVYWRRIEEAGYDRVFPLIKGDVVTVSESVTEEKLASLNNNLKITFTAYAVQYEGIYSHDKAWDIISKEDEV